MVRYDNVKKPKRQYEQPSKYVKQSEVLETYYDKKPSWSFNRCDSFLWSIFDEEVRVLFWDEIVPRLQAWEKQTWREILLVAKKQNHSIDVENLNKKAIDRLEVLHIEAEAIISLRLTGTHRIYGYIEKGVFIILWIDLYHGDNANCVCRSHKKNT